MSFRPKDHSADKACKTCGLVKSAENFYSTRRTGNRAHLQPYRVPNCIPCHNKIASERKKSIGHEWHIIENARKQKWIDANPEHVRIKSKITNLKKFNLTIEDYEKLKKDQNNVCAICKKPERQTKIKTKEIKDLAVDHCHKTGKIRGLLCFACNGSLGKFEDSIELLQSAIDYLKRHK